MSRTPGSSYQSIPSKIQTGSISPRLLLRAWAPLVIVILTAAAAGAQSLPKQSHPRETPASALFGCTFLSAPGTSPAFCETFDQPAGIGNRSGDLNGTLWGVSRLLGAVNSGQGQFYDVSPTTMQKCGQDVQVQPPNDVAICNGQLVEAQNDQGGVTTISMYPKQPFDIAGRTGTIAFDVSDDSHGNHRAWPELWYTDQPVPAPFVHFTSLQSPARNGFGVRFAGSCQAGDLACRFSLGCPNYLVNDRVVTVDSAVVINDYVTNDSFSGSNVPATISVQHLGCVKASSGPGDMNHFELRVSQNEIDVYGTDAGSATLKPLAAVTNAPLTLTRGLVWLEDVHYNGNKDGPDQGTHTFTWDNVAFDGPVLPRDLAFDVLDALTPVGPNYPGLLNLGWPVGTTDDTALTLTVPGVYNIAQATGAILTFNYSTVNPITISYRVNNGSWHDQPWVFPPCYTQNGAVNCGEKTIAVPVSLSDVQPGANTIQFKGTDFTAVANVDLILLGAAGGGCTSNCPVATTTTLMSSKNPSILGDRIALTATVTASSGIPSGSVTFSDSGTPIGVVPLASGGTAAFTASSLTVGTHSLTASYDGGAGFISSNSTALSQVVNAPVGPVATATALTSSKNPSTVGDAITLTATVTAGGGVPSGGVTFSDSGTPLATVALSSAGAATFTTSSFTVGTHDLTASYGGATGFMSSNSALLSQVVNAVTIQPTIRFDWESGTLSGWQVAWGRSVSISNSTNQAFSGTHSLKMAISAAETHSAVDYEAKPQLIGFIPGALVTFHVFSPSASGVTVYAFAYDENWLPAFGRGFQLQPGWNAVTYTIPSSFTGVNGVGVQINNSGPHSGTLYLDAVTTQ